MIYNFLRSPKKKEQFQKISLSRQTIARRIEDLEVTIKKFYIRSWRHYILLISHWSKYGKQKYCSGCLFVRGVNKSFDVTEELATVIPIKVTAQGSDLFEVVMTNPM